MTVCDEAHKTTAVSQPGRRSAGPSPSGARRSARFRTVARPPDAALNLHGLPTVSRSNFEEDPNEEARVSRRLVIPVHLRRRLGTGSLRPGIRVTVAPPALATSGARGPLRPPCLDCRSLGMERKCSFVDAWPLDHAAQPWICLAASALGEREWSVDVLRGPLAPQRSAPGHLRVSARSSTREPGGRRDRAARAHRRGSAGRAVPRSSVDAGILELERSTARLASAAVGRRAPKATSGRQHRWEHRRDGRWAYQPGHWHPQERHEERERHEHDYDHDRTSLAVE